MGITDIYDGETVDLWHDGEFATIAIHPNGLTFIVPLEFLEEFFSEMSKAQAAYQIQKIRKN